MPRASLPFVNKIFDNYCLLGWGRTGASVGTYLQSQGKKVCVWDDCSNQRSKASQDGWDVCLPQWNSWKGRIVVSPGVPWDNQNLCDARAFNIDILSDIQLFLEFFPHVRAIGVTGTNAKTTTCSLIDHGLRAMGHKSILAGNIGHPVFSSIDDTGFVDADAIYVLELSSYQLEYSKNLSLTVALILNLVPHHLERHKTMENYAAIKSSIAASAQHAWFPIDWPFPLKKSKASSYRWDPDLSRDWKLSSILQTPHNRTNTSAAMHVLGHFGTIRSDVWMNFEGIEHRQEVVMRYNKTIVINDSKATNPHASAAALGHWIKHCRYVIWIAGGVLQDDDLSVLNTFVSSIKGAIFMGQSAQRFSSWFQENGGEEVSVMSVSSVKKAVDQALTLAQLCSTSCDDEEQDGNCERSSPHVCVLFSPGCASQDIFQNFEHRGHVFKACVHQWMHDNTQNHTIVPPRKEE